MSAKSLLSKAGGKVADGISRLSSLSPEQLQKVQQQRDEYLSQMPDPTDSSTALKFINRILLSSINCMFRSRGSLNTVQVLIRRGTFVFLI